MAEAMRSRFPLSWNPSTSSSQIRYIQPAEPVYQVQPHLPARPGENETSAATAYGSPRYFETEEPDRVRSAGFTIWSNRTAAEPSPDRARACASQRAPCVYCPPFSRTPGGYPMM